MIESAQARFPVTNTLALTSFATQGQRFYDIDQIQAARLQCAEQDKAWIALGAGSNIVPLSVIDAFVASIEIMGVQLIEEDAEHVWIEVGAGQNWHEWVTTAIHAGWHGLENLVSIPGTVGAAPIQNIGAYGAEVSHSISRVTCVDEQGARLELAPEGCEFEYRTSVFKRRPELTVVSVQFKLAKRFVPIVTYPEVVDGLDRANFKLPSARQLAELVSSIRKRKLPDPTQYPNVGSFFKNPVVAEKQANQLQATVQPQALQRYAGPRSDLVKLSAAQLIDSLGWKEVTTESIYCWPSQALVLVNRSASSGEEVLHFAERVQRSVEDAYGVSLELEPSVLS